MGDWSLVQVVRGGLVFLRLLIKRIPLWKLSHMTLSVLQVVSVKEVWWSDSLSFTRGPQSCSITWDLILNAESQASEKSLMSSMVHGFLSL